LLDFGATRALSDPVVAQFKALIEAGLSQHRGTVEAIATQIGLIADDMVNRHRDQIVDMILVAFEEMTHEAVIDFATSKLVSRLNEMGQALAEDGFVPPPLPLEFLYIQRKIAGMFLLASRLKARVPIRALVTSFVDEPQ